VTTPTAPAAADGPALPGLRCVDLIDEGGFAQVFRYHDERMERDVAVKVLRLAIESDSFVNEARIMARLSDHPHIVTIFDQGMLADGRPYLIMEYCPPPNFKRRSEDTRLPVELVLDVGVSIAGAVETAHRAGILHRDIKPANILTNRFGDPLLTDFGIASARDATATGRSAQPSGVSDELEALSLPWAAPEAVLDGRFEERSDVYALAATMFTLATGRWPYAIEGASNEWDDIVERLQRQPPQRMGRPDIPPAFEELLRRAMSRDPARRPSSALEFAQDLLEVGPPGWRPREPLVPEETAAAVRQVREDARSRSGAVIAAGWPESAANGDTVSREPLVDLDDTVARAPGADRPGRARWLVAGACLVAALVALAFILMPGQGDSGADPDPDPEPAAPELVEAPQTPQSPSWQKSGSSLVVRWKAPDAQPGDTYYWQRTSGDSGAATQASAPETFATLTGLGGNVRVCVDVFAVRGGSTSRPLNTCWPRDK
jgi:hypothetical protein